jgi:signal transduction histidine kinase
MKLFTKYSRVNLVASILVLLLGGICYYFMIRYVLIRQLDDTLKVEEAEILDHVRTRGTLPEPSNYRDQQIQFTPAQTKTPRKFIDVQSYSQDERKIRRHRYKLFRQLIFPLEIQGQIYMASVSKSEEETEDLLALIVLITLSVILLLLLTVFLTNRLLLRKIWRPFYHTLESIKQFNLSSRQRFAGQDTGIDEFSDLDSAVGQMTGKILKDYEMLKNFADNASHEMQTPLAIINSKLDLLIQGHALDERQTRQLQDMYDAVGRLRQLNQSLLLLTKIENKQFAHLDHLSVGGLVDRKLLQFEELIASGGLRVTRETSEQAQDTESHLEINGYLADILLNNLLSNAIRHNREGGSIDIRVENDRLTISNTGSALRFDPATIFDRFVKDSHSGGTGLGLAIVRQICDNYHFSLSYIQDADRHTVTVDFKPSV